MADVMEDRLTRALKDYGEAEYIIQKTDIPKKIKKNAYYENVPMTEAVYGTARAVFGSYGRILKESDDKKSYVFISRAPKQFDNEALFVTEYDNETLKIGAYAKEGLFYQGIAEKETRKMLENIEELNNSNSQSHN